MATKQAQRQSLDVRLGTEGRLIGRLYLRSGKRSAFRYAPHALVKVAA
jgi:serine/threonine-protein kinase HipA